MITIIGASGQIGSKVARELLDTGVRVRALGRNHGLLAPLTEAGADVRVGDIEDTEWLTDSLGGSDAVFALVPSNPFSQDYTHRQEQLGESICAAMEASGISTVVAMSSLGADKPDAPGVIGALHRQERRLATLSARVTVLRPVSFFENLMPAVDQLIESGSHVDSVQADLPIPMIGTVDVARAACAALTDSAWSGHVVRDLLGERDLSYNEATAILGRHLAIGDAEYVQLQYEDMIGVLTGIGFSREYARQYIDMTRAFNSRELTDPVPRTAANTTPTSFEHFVSSLHTPAGRAS